MTDVKTAVAYDGYTLADIPQDDMLITRMYLIEFATIFVVHTIIFDMTQPSRKIFSLGLFYGKFRRIIRKVSNLSQTWGNSPGRNVAYSPCYG
ncbi:unnamed protein product, partial [Brenthis ino]